MADKKADRAQIGEIDLQGGSEDRLKSTANSPKVRDFGPSLAAGEKGDNDRNHRPITELKRKSLFPVKKLVLPKIDREAKIVDQEENAEADSHPAINATRATSAHGDSES